MKPLYRDHMKSSPSSHDGYGSDKYIKHYLIQLSLALNGNKSYKPPSRAQFEASLTELMFTFTYWSSYELSSDISHNC